MKQVIESLTDKNWKQPNKINLHSLIWFHRSLYGFIVLLMVSSGCHTHTRALAIEHFVVSVGDHHIRIQSIIQGENNVRKQYLLNSESGNLIVNDFDKPYIFIVFAS